MDTAQFVTVDTAGWPFNMPHNYQLAWRSNSQTKDQHQEESKLYKMKCFKENSVKGWRVDSAGAGRMLK